MVPSPWCAGQLRRGPRTKDHGRSTDRGPTKNQVLRTKDRPLDQRLSAPREVTGEHDRVERKK
jgi:hypothetical protein